MNQEPQKLTLPDRVLAYQQRSAAKEGDNRPCVLFLGGFASDMTGTKATFLDEQCAKAGWGFLRFDYRGHGGSSGKFIDGSIGDWLDDAVQVMDRLAKGPQLVVGSSMGGWIGLLLARHRPDRVAGFVGLAAAPDFTEDLIRPAMTPAQVEAMRTQGYFFEDLPPAIPEDQRLPITRRLMEDGRDHCVLRSPLLLNGPVRLVQGQQDVEVPWKTALTLASHIGQEDVHVTLIKDAGHRLSRPKDLALIWEEIASVMAQIAPES